jgi:hypothetical protein
LDGVSVEEDVVEGVLDKEGEAVREPVGVTDAVPVPEFDGVCELLGESEPVGECDAWNDGVAEPLGD